MKVVALIQFYLPYFLPRTPEWSEHKNFQFQFEVEGHLVNVHPRRADENLFPSPFDEQLAQAKFELGADFIVPLDAPTEIPLRDRCFDRVEVQVFGEVASREDCASSELAFAYRRRAISGCNKFLYICRVAGRDPDIEGLIWYYSFDHARCYFATPHSLIWFDAESLEPLRDDEGRVLWAVSGGSLRSPLRLPVDFGLIKQTFSAAETDLPVALLVSAKERLISDQLSEGIINLGSACEIASTRYVERKGLRGNAQVKSILNARQQTFAEKRFHHLPLHVDARSLKTEDAAAFDLLEKAYLTRNKLAHSGELAYKDPASQVVVAVTRSMAIEFFRGCERAVEWMNGLLDRKRRRITSSSFTP